MNPYPNTNPAPNTLADKPKELRLERAGNGGWIVYAESSDRSIMADVIAAYSNHADLIKGLDHLLRPFSLNDHIHVRQTGQAGGGMQDPWQGHPHTISTAG